MATRAMAMAMLERCERLLKLIPDGESERPGVRGAYLDTLNEFDKVASYVEGLDDTLLKKMVEFEGRAMEADWEIYMATRTVIGRLAVKTPNRTIGGLSGSMFLSGSESKLPRIQHEIRRWLSPTFQLEVLRKDAWLSTLNRTVVALRWLSFRSFIRKHPEALVTLSEAIVAAGRKRGREDDAEEDDKKGCEPEKFHYDLMEALCVHAASGQPGIDFKRLRRAANNGEDITVVMNEKRTGIELKRFLRKEMTGTPYEKLLSLSEEVMQLFYYMLDCKNWTGRQAGGLIFAHLLFCLEASFRNGMVERLKICPVFPSFHGSKEPMLQLYDRKRLYQSSDPEVVFDVKPSDGFQGLVALVTRICEINGVTCVPLQFVTDDNELLEVVVGEELIYSGRNSVVLSCRRIDAESCTSVVKVQPEAHSRREEAFHNELDKLDGIRRKESSGYVVGAGIGLRFIQLAGFGTPFSSNYLVGDRAAAEFAHKACETVQSIHQLSILHCDIKPNNFIVVDGRLLLNDFDLSCDMDDRERLASPVGTPLFMSPRLGQGAEYDELDDWMSLGLSFMYLTGVHRSEATKVTALRAIATAPWAPQLLKERVAAGLEDYNL